ncbi:MAG: hypothetical protein AVDCRST_MAG49-314, partial [uncultured Thermomicrobiales bacterium]
GPSAPGHRRRGDGRPNRRRLATVSSSMGESIATPGAYPGTQPGRASWWGGTAGDAV